MTKQFSLIQMFAIVDGRLAGTMDDVYDVLNHITDSSLMTHELPTAMNYVTEKNPSWLSKIQSDIDALGIVKDGEWLPVYKILEANNRMYDIPQLKDEFDTSDLNSYMMQNSLLLKRFSN